MLHPSKTALSLSKHLKGRSSLKCLKTSSGNPRWWRGGLACLQSSCVFWPHSSCINWVHPPKSKHIPPEGHVCSSCCWFEMGEGKFTSKKLPKTETEGEDISLKSLYTCPNLTSPTFPEYFVHWVKTSGAIQRRFPGCFVMFCFNTTVVSATSFHHLVAEVCKESGLSKVCNNGATLVLFCFGWRKVVSHFEGTCSWIRILCELRSL